MADKSLLHYEVIEKIGAGGMGEVYRARDTKLGRDVALKILPDAFASDGERLTRFEREARVLASLNHPHIASIHGLEQSGSSRFLVLEFVTGEDLAERLSRGPIPLQETVAIARQIAEALEDAHERGIIHRDLKPANVKLSDDGKVKVLDFGLAKALEAEAGNADSQLSMSPTVLSSGTLQGVILGTAAYMSPEQARGKPVDRRTDIWAFGCVLFEMLTGRQLFSGETVSDTLAAVLRAQPPLDSLPASTPRSLRRLIARCLDRDLGHRLQAIGEARIVLENVSSGDEAENDVVSKTPPWARRLPWGVAVLAVVAAAWMAFMNPSGESQPAPQLTANITTPPGVSIHTKDLQLALSPDGQQLAFAGIDEAGDVHLYIRRLDTGETRMLAGTQNALTPFWSPDSRHVGFFTDAELKRVDVAGGQIQTIVQVNGRDGAWNREGNILYSMQSESALALVSAAGGTPSMVWGPLGEERTPLHPRFLPDGRNFVCSVVDYVDGANTGIYTGELGTNDARRLAKAMSNVQYLEPGYLLYMQGSNLVAHQFDDESRELRGEPIRVAGPVTTMNYPFVGLFSVSPQGRLVYLPGSSTAGMSEMVWLDRSGNEIEALGVKGDLYNPRLSHDGRRLAIDISDGARTHGDIWVFDLARRSSIRLTDDPADESLPVWSPDDSEVYFFRSPDLFKRSRTASSPVERVFASDKEKYTRDVSPDGRYLLFQLMDGQSDLWLLDLVSGEAVAWTSTPHDEARARFSPDGRWIAYQSSETGRDEIYIEGFPEHGERFTVSREGGANPAWRRDGKELYYVTPADQLMAVAIDMDATDHAPIGEPVELFSTRFRRDHFDPSRDGQRFVVNRRIDSDAVTSVVLMENWADDLTQP